MRAAPRITMCAILAAMIIAPSAWAQSLFQRSASPGQAARDPAEPLYATSLYAVRPPEPREFSRNDLITIVITETSSFERNQTVETEKEYENSLGMLNSNLLRQFLELRLPLDGVEAGESDLALSDQQFESEGEYEREDEVRGRVTARVMEVKPNGTLLLEAKSVVKTDGEEQTFTLSGLCRTEDVAENNTVLSNQLYNLRLDVQHEGEIRRSTKKGLIPRVLETIFNF